jgi:hypothetical protein
LTGPATPFDATRWPTAPPPSRGGTLPGDLQLVVPGFVGGQAAANVCRSTTSGGVETRLVPLGWSFVCNQVLQAATPANLDRIGCGRADVAVLGPDFFCASPSGLPAGVAPSTGLFPLNTQCASGFIAGNVCGGRPAGGLCLADTQCAAGTTCNPATGRCGTLLGFGGVASGSPRDANDPAIFRQCRANGYIAAQDICMATPGQSQTNATFCASGSLTGANCALSEPGEFCGADADCATGLGCNIEERRCVAHANAAAGTAPACASGIVNGTTCQAGQRGDACVLPTTATGQGTCASGLLCLERICR